MTARPLAIAGARWTSLASAVTILVQVLQLAILARLLAPADFGLVAIVVAVIGLLHVAADAGVSNAVIHRQSVGEDELSSLYWLNVAAGAALALAAVAASPWIAALYGEPALAPLLALASVHLVLSSAWQLLRALAQKALRFAPLAAIEIGGSLAGLVAAVLLARADAGPFALIGGVLAGSSLAAVLAWWLLAGDWRPRLRLRIAEIRGFVGFGAYAVGTELANAAASQMDVLIGGRLVGAQPIGLYGVSRNLCLQVASTVNPIVTRVALPLMARAQRDRAELRMLYLRTLRMTASVNFPLYVVLWVFADEVVALLLGSQWQGAAALVRVLAAWALIRSTVNPVGSLLMACGRADLNFRWSIAWLLATPPVVWIGAGAGAQGIAAALLAMAVAGWVVPTWHFLVRPLCGATLAEYLRELAIPLALACAAGAAAWLAALPIAEPAARIALGVAAGAATYLALAVRFNRVWLEAMRDILGLGPRA